MLQEIKPCRQNPLFGMSGGIWTYSNQLSLVYCEGFVILQVCSLVCSSCILIQGIIHDFQYFHKRTESSNAFYIPPPLPYPKVYYKNVDWLNLFHIATGTVAKIKHYLKHTTGFTPSPLAYSLYSCKNVKMLWRILM